MKLTFVIDKKWDKHFIADKKKLPYFEKQYNESLKILELARKEYQNSWDEINGSFSDYIEKVTGYKWFYSDYECIISVIHRGITNWGYAPLILREWKEDPYSMRRITAHELIISHYFEIYKRHYKKEGLRVWQIWALAEIAAWALTSLTPNVKKWWPHDAEYYTNHNYPQLVELQKKMKPIFLKRKNFNEYIKKGVELARNIPSQICEDYEFWEEKYSQTKNRKSKITI